MCTALTFKTEDFYFGRTLDLDFSLSEQICILPRNFPLRFRLSGELSKHHAIIGMAAVIDGVPLLYDGANEYGLAMAGLNFPENACYAEPCEAKTSVAPFEFIPFILGQCRSVAEARELLESISLVNIPFSQTVENSPLHFIISDGFESIVAEPMKDGLHIYDNRVGVLTNNPPFPYQLENLERYKDLRTDNSKVKRTRGLPYSDYCQGLGALGLPGDLSSASRFVRIAFGKENSVKPKGEEASVGQFFHLLSTVEMVKGLCVTDKGTLDYTVYASCINADRGIYYYTTYELRAINGVNMNDYDLEDETVMYFPLKKDG